MSKAFATFINTIIGYLSGAGLGALSLDLLSNHSYDERQTAALALFVSGPIGALLVLLTAMRRRETKAI